MTRKRVALVAGARPNFMKVAPLYHALTATANDGFEVTLIHTGQHYDSGLSDVFFRDLNLPRPDVALDVGSGSHGAQTARVLERFEKVLVEREPDLVMVVGDVNSTIACALATVKMVYPSGHRPLVAHVEAGLRSFDRAMPEEINRVLTDSISDLLFTTEESAALNLEREGVPRHKVFFVGNVMIDTLRSQASRAADMKAWEQFGLEPRQYGVVTLHRPSNVDDPATLSTIMSALQVAGGLLPLLFPVHPRTLTKLEHLGITQNNRIRVIPPLPYVEFLSLMSGARVVLTDSGGIQEETTILGIPCLTLRENTERPITLTQGTNVLVGTDRHRILETLDAVLSGRVTAGTTPALWDGNAAQRIVDVLEQFYSSMVIEQTLLSSVNTTVSLAEA